MQSNKVYKKRTNMTQLRIRKNLQLEKNWMLISNYYQSLENKQKMKVLTSCAGAQETPIMTIFPM